MTVEIKQLVIRAIAEPSRPAAAVVRRPQPPRTIDHEAINAINAIIEACVREVLRELDRRRRR
jgi:hypothetical protein